MKLFFISGNAGKLKEAKNILNFEIEGLDIDLKEIQSLDPHEIIKNKLEEARKKFDGKFIVEDVSLNFECLNGLPGPLIKWFLKSLGAEGLVKIVKTFGNNKATAKCIIGYFNEMRIEFFEGVVNGKIVEPKGNNGFGWDPIFLPDGSNKTYAEMSDEEKNKVSHRRKAFERFREFITLNTINRKL